MYSDLVHNNCGIVYNGYSENAFLNKSACFTFHLKKKTVGLGPHTLYMYLHTCNYFLTAHMYH